LGLRLGHMHRPPGQHGSHQKSGIKKRRLILSDRVALTA
jgi:hypothetical protein